MAAGRHVGFLEGQDRLSHFSDVTVRVRCLL